MNRNGSVSNWLRHSLIAVAAATLMTACAEDAPLAPDRPATYQAYDSLGILFDQEGVAARDVELGSCSNLQAPEGSKLAFRTYATGVQIYRWNGTGWGFVAPSADLHADASGNETVGSHYAGPTWESVSGSKVVAAVDDRCLADPNAIPWLLLRAVSTEGPGIFERVTFIQRVNTVGGNAPAAAGTFVGQETRVPYSAEYLFYRAQ